MTSMSPIAPSDGPVANSELPRPIVVDLDGTLIRTDFLVEGLCQSAGREFVQTGVQFVKNYRKPEVLKDWVMARCEIDAATLPYNTDLVEWLRAKAKDGHPLYLASASPEPIVEAVAAHLGIFEGVLGSDAMRNLKGEEKLSALRELLGETPFTYVGDSRADVPLWNAAAEAVTVNASAGLRRQVSQTVPQRAMNFEQDTPRDILKGLRPHQWVKNLLVFLPMLAGHAWADTTVILLSLLTFVVFSACASSIYLINDLLDIEDDRHHATKKNRPIASGRLSAKRAFGVAAMLIVASGVVTALISPVLLIPLGVYLAATVLYSIKVKTAAGLDVIWLAGLYTVRVVGGAVATGIVASTWLLTFCIFIFLSLACAKRCAELVTYRTAGREMNSRRGYQTSDLEAMTTLGVGSGMAGVVVLLIYLQDPATQQLYDQPLMLVPAAVLLLYWQCWLWLKVRRDEMHADPIVFALTDRNSQIALGLIALSFLLAAR